MSILCVSESPCAYGMVLQLLVILVRVGQENGHHCKYFKKESQHRKLSAYKSIGRTGRKNVREATTRCQVLF